MRKTIFLSLIAISLIAITIAGVISAILLRENLSDNTVDEMSNILTTAAVTANDQWDMNDLAESVSSANDDVRITVIGLSGTPLGDSHFDIAKMDNHANRPEVVGAKEDGIFTASRYSDTLGHDLLYVAYLTDSGYIFRAAVPTETLTHAFTLIIPALLIGMLVSIVICIIASSKISARILRPVVRVSEKITSVGQGDYDNQVEFSKYDELQPLVQSANTLASSIKAEVKQTKNEKEKLRFLIDNIEQGIIVLDRDMKILQYNFAAAALLGGTNHDIKHKSLMVLINNIKLIDAVKMTLKNDETSVFDIDFTSKDKIFSFTVSSVTSRWVRKGALIIITDVTENRHERRRRQEFLANASHELKTPVTAIKGFSELISSGIVTDESLKKDYNEKIGDEASRLDDIISDILNLSSLEEHKNIDLTLVDIKTLVDDTIEKLRQQWEKKNIKISVNGSASITAEKDDLSKLFKNLIENAIKYNRPDGEVGVTISESLSRVNIKISDTGIGIPKDDIPRVFERFYRVDKGRSRQVGGTGLGLSIVKQVITKYGGDIVVKSKLNFGTTINLWLPIYR